MNYQYNNLMKKRNAWKRSRALSYVPNWFKKYKKEVKNGSYEL